MSEQLLMCDNCHRLEHKYICDTSRLVLEADELRTQRDAAVAALRLSVQFVAKWTADYESVIGQRTLTRIEAALELCKEGE